jgi:hypothetical protein
MRGDVTMVTTGLRGSVTLAATGLRGGATLAATGLRGGATLAATGLRGGATAAAKAREGLCGASRLKSADALTSVSPGPVVTPARLICRAGALPASVCSDCLPNGSSPCLLP